MSSFKDRKLMNGWGTDRALYAFEVVSRKPIPIINPLSSRRKVTDFERKDGTDEIVPVPEET